MRMSKHNLIIYSLLLAAAPISVLADSSTTSAATVGMFSPPTAPSVGHRPGTPRDVYELKFKGLDFYIEKYTPFPGMTIARDVRYLGISDPDNNYQSAETFTTVCTYYQINKDNSQHILKREKPCEHKFNIQKEHRGSKIKLEIYNETDMASASGYTPVPSVSEFQYIETETISNTPSRDLTVMSIDKPVLSPGESATITTIVKDIDGNPVNEVFISKMVAYENSKGLWDYGPIKKENVPGKYTQVITYRGHSNERIDISFDYAGHL
ncbi:TPA: two-partner-like secretion system exoprotein ZirS, partial [Salmonella enterica subsp. enterica serovar Mississippi]